MPLRNYYTILQLPFNTPDDEVRAAYEALSKQYEISSSHGIKVYDKGYLDISKAYEKLRHPLQKTAYISQYTKEQQGTPQSAFTLNRPRRTYIDSRAGIADEQSFATAPLMSLQPEAPAPAPPPPLTGGSERPLSAWEHLLGWAFVILEGAYWLFGVYAVWAMHQSCNAVD